ncbi:50S ribosomal protein L25 [Patescibacteria group bacterium]|nr:50S ribosomal protein L25 [Patescibacteria group bacterium]
MKTHSLEAHPRTVCGRKVRQLRREGAIPGTVYGKKIKSVSVTVTHDAFVKTYADTGETGLVTLTLGTEERPVLIHNVQRNVLNGDVLHVEFYQVDLKEKVRANVPIAFTGASPAVAQKTGVLLTILDELEVEALPAALPEHIAVDVSKLSEVGQELKVSDIPVPQDVTVLTDGKLTVAKVGELVTREAEAEAAAEAAAAAAASAQAETGDVKEGTEPEGGKAEGEEKQDQKKEDTQAKES